jgi:beta-lactamase regulating signal transducer with metallopeptidase domain/peroxiredoxin
MLNQPFRSDDPWAWMALEVTAKATLLLLMAAILALLLGRSSAALRHRLWAMVFVALLLLPLASVSLPGLGLPVIPRDWRVANAGDGTVRSTVHRPEPEILAASVRSNPALLVHDHPPDEAANARAAPDLGPEITTPVFQPVVKAVDVPPLAAQFDSKWFRLAWLIGVFSVLIPLACGMLGNLRMIRRGRRVADNPLRSLLDELCGELGLRRDVILLLLPVEQMPMTFGFLRSYVVLPKQAIGWTDERLRMVLLHELAHVKRRDITWQLVARVACALYWFHPLVWWALRRMRIDRESACDDCVLATGQKASRYATQLLEIARIHHPCSPLTTAAMSMARRSQLEGRLRAVLDVRRARSPLGLARAATLSFATVVAVLSLGVLRLGVQAAPAGTSSAASEASPVRSSVSGTVRDDDGRPIAGATIKVHSAAVRVGTSPYCPTCYADCAKLATTDKDGQFSIPSLDSTLIFRLLAIADGHQPRFIDKVDPSAAGPIDVRLVARPIPDDPTRAVRGTVYDPAGKPAARVVVEPYGCKAGARRWYGSMPGVDALAVTDDDGKFALVCDQPVDALDLMVEARGALRRNVPLVPSGLEPKRIDLEFGTTIEGRVVRDGHGVSGVSVGVLQADRGMEKHLGPYQIGTDAEGRFSLPNMPAGQKLRIYGIMDTLREMGAVANREFESAKDGVSQVGDLPIEKAYRLSGRVALADGKPVPPHTRVMIVRDGTRDSTFAETDAEGHFVATGIPPEIIEIFINIPGYHLSPKNQSFEPLNANQLKGLMPKETNDLIILLEPGKPTRPDISDGETNQRVFAKYEKLKTRPIMGVTSELQAPPDTDDNPPATPLRPNAEIPPPLPKIAIPPPPPAIQVDANGPVKTITGIVVDAEGKAVAGAQVWLPVRWVLPTKSLAFMPSECLTATARCDDQGRFHLAVPEAWLPQEVGMGPVSPIWAYASGHAIGAASAYAQLLYGETTDEPCTIELPPASDISFVVRSADNQPAAGAKLAPEFFQTKEGFGVLPSELLDLITATTDADGRARLPALSREGIEAVAVTFAGYGKQVFRVGKMNNAMPYWQPGMKPTDPAEHEIMLRRAGRIEGHIVADQVELTRGMFVSVRTAIKGHGTVPFETQGKAIARVDERGRYVIPEIAYGDVRDVSATCDMRLPVRPRLPQWNQFTLLEGQTLQIDIPLEMAVRVGGVVRAKDTGDPLAGVMVSVPYKQGLQEEDWVVTDEHGRYSAFVLAGDVQVQIISRASGYEKADRPWADSPLKVPQGVQEFELPVIEVDPAPGPKPGEDVSDFSFELLDGGQKKLSQLRGQYVLLDFWIPGQAPFVASLPALRKLHDKYHAGGRLTVISLSLDTDKSKARQFVEQRTLPWILGSLDDSTKEKRLALLTQLGVTSLSTHLLIDPTGKLVAKYNSVDEATKKIESVLGPPPIAP